MQQRIQKIIAQSGFCSRRQAETHIKNQSVKINNKLATLGDKARFADEITINGVPIGRREEKVYYLINKPPKTICTLKDPENRTIITDFISETKRIFPVGRLDYNTTGTLILTNDGELSQRLTHPKYKIKRVYRVRLNDPLSAEELVFLNSDKVVVKNKKSLQKVEKTDNKTYLVTLWVGSYHHVKELFALVNKLVLKLVRVEFAGVTHVNNLSVGHFRKLKKREIMHLKSLVNLL